MRLALLLLISVAVLSAVSTSGWAWQIPGSNNELLNWNFEDSPIIGYDGFGRPIYGGGPWVLGNWIKVEMDGTQLLAANCKNELEPAGLWMYQIVDESMNPLWMEGGTQKYVDLVAKIRVMGDSSNSTVKFQLGWWDTDFPEKPENLPLEGGKPVFPTSGFQLTDPVVCTFAEPGIWYPVNPFNRILLPSQPRWMIVYVEFGQVDAETVWVDDLVLTGKCIPEPASIALGVLGLGSVAGFKRFRKK